MAQYTLEGAREAFENELNARCRRHDISSHETTYDSYAGMMEIKIINGFKRREYVCDLKNINTMRDVVSKINTIFDHFFGLDITNSCSNPFAIEKVIYNGPATIVIWGDGTKTIVKCTENDAFDPEKGLAMAISKKALGNDFKEVKKWANTYEEPTKFVFDIKLPTTKSMAQTMSENLSKLHNALLKRRGDLSL